MDFMQPLLFQRRKIMEKEEQALIDEALKVYRISRRYVLGNRVDPETNEAVIVTHGGKKFRHKKGETAKFELTETEITGEPPKDEMVWHEKLNQKIRVKDVLKKLKK